MLTPIVVLKKLDELMATVPVTSAPIMSLVNRLPVVARPLIRTF